VAGDCNSLAETHEAEVAENISISGTLAFTQWMGVPKMTNDNARKSTGTLSDFVATHSRIIWGGGAHEKKSLAKMARFCSFQAYGKQRLDSFISADLYEFMSHIETTPTPRKPNGCSPATTNRYVACLSAVFKHAEEMGLIEQAPRVKFRKISKHEQHKRRFLSDRELDALLGYLAGLPEDYRFVREFVIIGINTGMRLGEIRSLDPDNIEHDENGAWLVLERTKNGDDRRVPANDAVLEALAKLDNRPALHFREHPFYEAMRAARQAVAPNDKSFVFHSLRHTAASTMANDLQINTILIARLLGHKSLKTTEGYVHIKGDAAANVGAQLGRRFSQNSSTTGSK
jgi:integrase